MNYYAQEEYVEEEDGGKTPTPHDPHIKRRTRKVYSTEICGSGADGLEGLKSYVSSQKESDGFIFAFLTLPDSKWGPSTVFLSWTSSSPNVLPIRRLCIMDIKPAFQSSSVWLLYTQQGDRRSLLELSGPKLESVLKPVTKNVDKCDFPSIIQQDGEVIEWFAVDTGHLNDTDSSSHKSTRHTDDLTPQESILQEVESQLFDEFWSEIPSLLSPVLRSLVQFKTKKPSRASSIQLSSSRMDPPQELHTNENDDDISIFDTMQIDELMKGPNLCSAMTIKPVPLQKRDGMGKLRVL